MLSSIRSNQPYANEPVYILEHRWSRCWMGENDTTARIVRGRGRESTTARGFTGITRPANTCRWRHRWWWVRRLLPLPDLPGNAVGNGLLARTERVTEGVRFDDWTKIAHPTNGVLVLVVVIRRRRRRRQRLPRRGGWVFRSSRPPRQTRNEHVLYDSCRQRSERMFWRANARGHGACVLDDIVNQILE